MDEQRIKDQLSKLETKADPFVDSFLDRLRGSKWKAAILLVVIVVLVVIGGLLL